MKQKEKIKIYTKIFRTGLLILLISIFGCMIMPFFAHAFTYTPEPYSVMDSFQYDNNGKLEFTTHMTSQLENYQMLFTNEAGGYPNTSFNFTIFTNEQRNNTSTLMSFGSRNICENTPTQHYIYGVTSWYYSVGSSGVHCYPTEMNITYYNGQYRNQTIYNATGLTKTDIDNATTTNFFENNLFIPDTSTNVFTINFKYIDLNWTQNSITVFNQVALSQSVPSQFPFTGAVASICGSSNTQTFYEVPTENLCASGSLVGDVVAGDDIYGWVCQGTGQPAICYANRLYYPPTADSPVPASCGAAKDTVITTMPTENLCLTGYNNTPHFTQTNQWSWKCYDTVADLQSQNPNAVTTCSTPIVGYLVDGACGLANGEFSPIAPVEETYGGVLCSGGYASEVIENQAKTGWEWTCKGYNGGTDSTTCMATRNGGINLQNEILKMILPSAGTLAKMENFTKLLDSHVPFGYVKAGRTAISNFVTDVSAPPDNYILEVPSPLMDNTMIPAFDFNAFKTSLGDWWYVYWNLMIATQWIAFFVWVIRKGRSVVGDMPDDLENQKQNTSDPMSQYPLWKE